MSELFRNAVEKAFARLREEHEATNAKRQAMLELVVRFKAECHGESIGNAIITADIVGNDLVLKINDQASYVWTSEDDFCRLYNCSAPSVDLAATDTLQEMADLTAAIIVETI